MNMKKGSKNAFKAYRRAKRGKIRSWLSLGVVTILGSLAFIQVGFKSHYSNTLNTPGLGRGRMLTGNNTPPEPVISDFCDSGNPNLAERIELVGNTTEVYNAWLRTYGDGVCEIDYTDYSSYPPAFVDPCSVSGILVLIIGLLYTFAGLAIVCDEFFVPALEVMVEVFNISNDVAGATLMAAGGSAPELFTSIMGTFLSKSNVGFGTIVGSAVFNVLFVIGMCALFSKELLCLTWWPLARDSSYYAVSLSILAYFYQNGDKTEINLVESIVLFCMYIGYVILMKFNEKLRVKITACLSCGRQQVAPSDSKYVVKALGDDDDKSTGSLKRGVSNPFLFHNHFRSGIIHLMTREQNLLDQLRMRIVTEIKGDAKETFDQLDLNKSNHIDPPELIAIFEKLTGEKPPDSEISKVFKDLGVNRDEGIPFEKFKNWYEKAEKSILCEAKRYFDIMDRNNDGTLDRSEINSVIQSMSQNKGEEVSQEALDAAWKQFDKNKDESINFEEFSTWYQKTMLWRKVLEDVADLEEEDGGPLELEWPDGAGARVAFLLTLPIVFPLWLTIPDVRREGRQSFYPLTWTLAIAWIAFFSYFMVWWAMLLGDAAGLPPSVMGVTFLAAGTSIPDLITSVIVARQGFGDMAVSSSIGSNIFDILVGLPIPWMLYNVVYEQPIKVIGDDLFWSVVILILMLVSVIITIALNKWRMTKGLGFTMFFLYVGFVAFDLYRQSTGC